MSEQAAIFEEKQYLGFNKLSIIRRTVLAIFCFLLYFFNNDPDDQSVEFIFFVGVLILVLSVILFFVLHLQTRVVNGSLILEGLWTARKVKIDLASIALVERIDYSRYLFNRPVYNLHRKGKIRFFTQGSHAIQLTDKDGLIYIIGTQHPAELEEALNSSLH